MIGLFSVLVELMIISDSHSDVILFPHNGLLSVKKRKKSEAIRTIDWATGQLPDVPSQGANYRDLIRVRVLSAHQKQQAPRTAGIGNARGLVLLSLTAVSGSSHD